MNKILYFFHHPQNIFIALLEKYGGWIPDKTYLKMSYYLHTGKILHLNPPKTFNEKMQWLKLNDRKPLYTSLVDKVEVKDYVANIIGKEYIIPTLGVWDKPEDINYDILPPRFVLKTTHDGGGEGVIICDKKTLDVEKIQAKLNKSLIRNIYKTLREWPYKNIKPRIMAEMFMQSDNNSDGLMDYKFFCFNGEPVFCQVKSHQNGRNYIDLFDMNRNLLPFSCLNPSQKNAEVTPVLPDNYDKMIALVKDLCKVSYFVRVDFYNVSGDIYFGELTFYPASGMGSFTPEDYDLEMGNMLKLGN